MTKHQFAYLVACLIVKGYQPLGRYVFAGFVET